MLDVGVLALVPDVWTPQFQSRAHLLKSLAKHFAIVWINPPHLKSESAIRSARTNIEGLAVYSAPWYLPKLYRAEWADRLTFWLRLKQAAAMLNARRIVLYIWRPQYIEAVELLRHDLSIYHIDDEYSFSEEEQPMTPQERRAIEAADAVFIHSPGLWEKKGGINPRTFCVPNGVDFALASTEYPEPRDLASIPHPRIGYAGVVKRTLDWSLLEYLIASRPQWNFVFVGKISDRETEVTAHRIRLRYKNVFFLGTKSTSELYAYPSHFDVCLMPYALTTYAYYGYPLKLHEYLAAGKPCVGCRMRTLLDFADVVALPQTSSDWLEAIEHAVRPSANEPEMVSRRRAIAEQHDWGRLAEKVAAVINESLPRP